MGLEKVVIREYQPKDLEEILRLVKEMESELEDIFPDVKIKSCLDDYRKRYLKQGTKYKILVASIDEKLVGYIIGYPSVGSSQVDSMYDVLNLSKSYILSEFCLWFVFVSKPYRNKGISKKMYKPMIEYARRQGYKKAIGTVAKWNKANIAVLRCLGFQEKDLSHKYIFSLGL